MTDILSHDIDFLFRAAEFKNVKRQWYQYHMSDCINVAEHTYRVAWIAVILAALHGRKDFKDVILTALFHDLPEAVSGDFHRMNKIYVTEKLDMPALNEFVKGTSLEQTAVEYFTDYEDKRTEAGKFAKDADLLEYELEFVERGIKTDRNFASWKDYATAYSEKKMNFPLSKELRSLAVAANPHEWHQRVLAPEMYSVNRNDKLLPEIHFMFEIGTMRRIDRNWSDLRNTGFFFDNIAGHSLRMIWIALILAIHEQADLEKTLRAALLYNITVTRTGDDYPFTRPYTKTDRAKAFRDIIAGTVLEPVFAGDIEKIDGLETPESKIVSDAKYLDTFIELARVCRAFHHDINDTRFFRWADAARLQTKTAKDIWNIIKATEIHE